MDPAFKLSCMAFASVRSLPPSSNPVNSHVSLGFLTQSDPVFEVMGLIHITLNYIKTFMLQPDYGQRMLEGANAICPCAWI